MSSIVASLIGPRVPPDLIRRHPHRYWIPTALMIVGAISLIVSAALPWWRMTLNAPQYPKGLHLVAHINSIAGDVAEIDTLNHYIGMRPLGEAAPLERKLAWFAVGAMASLLVAATFTHSRWAALLALPAISFPAVFLLDLGYWMHDFGMNLDPTAALSKSIKPFSPPVLGLGKIGQFSTHGVVGEGLVLAAVGGSIVILALWFHRRAYKPLVIQQRQQGRSPA